MWLKFLYTTIVVCCTALLQAQQPTITAYYAGNANSVNQYDVAGLTHIIFSFCHLKGAKLAVDNAADTATIQQLVALKYKNPQLKVLLSLGGWGGCATCSDVFASKKNRKEFAKSVKRLNAFFKTDGIDLDWEYPAIEGHPGHAFNAADKENFTALIKSLRKDLGNKQEISFAAGGFKKFIDESVDWDKVMPLVNRVNVMTYDLVNGYAKATGHHTPLYATTTQTDAADHAVELLLKKGVAANKIVLGAAFYGRAWQNVSNTNNGLYQSGTFKSAVGFKDFEKEFPAAKGFRYNWDDVAKAPYLYSADEKVFVTFDDARSLTEKMKYVNQKGLNGIMFWELSNDVSKAGLLDAIIKAKPAK